MVDSASCENLAGAFILIYDELHNQAGALIVRGEGTSRGLICTCGSPEAVAVALHRSDPAVAQASKGAKSGQPLHVSPYMYKK